MSVVSVDELQRAWQAVQAGQFRRLPRHHPRTATDSVGDDEPASVWSPVAPVLAVVGCHPAAGASTLAAAVAHTFTGPAQLVEACGASASGLVGYATAELGATSAGWVRGNRDHVVVDRVAGQALTPGDIPTPHPTHDVALHVLDPGWDLEALVRSAGWLRGAVLDAEYLVLVTTATVPGMRRLEGALFQFEASRRGLAVAVRGARARRWPREVRHCLSSQARAVLDGALVEVPHDPGLHVRGLDTAPLPDGVLAAAAQLLQLSDPATPIDDRKGTTHVRP